MSNLHPQPAALANLQVLTDAALLTFAGSPTKAADWLESPHIGLGGMAPMEVAALGGVLTAHAIRLLPFQLQR